MFAAPSVAVPAPLLVTEMVALAPLEMTPLKLMFPEPPRVKVLAPLPVAVVFEVNVSVRPDVLAVMEPPEEEVVLLLKSMTLSVVSSAAPSQRIVPMLVPEPSWIVLLVPRALLAPEFPMAVTTTVPSSIFMPPEKLLLFAKLRSRMPWAFLVTAPVPEMTPVFEKVFPEPTRSIPPVATETLFERVAFARAESVPLREIVPVPSAAALLKATVPEEMVVLL